jgi:hypothetical protein
MEKAMNLAAVAGTARSRRKASGEEIQFDEPD